MTLDTRKPLVAHIRETYILKNRRVRRKIDFIILPIFLVTQALQFMDRTALNYANLFNYQTSLGLKGSQFNYITAGE